MQHKIVGIFVCLLILFCSFPLTANIISSNQQVEPDGKILFTAWTTGSCGVAWGYGLTNESNPPGGYVEPGKGIIINFGSMPYHTLNSPLLLNYLVEGNDEEVLWKIKGKTLLRIDWQHEGVTLHLQGTCSPMEETTGTFSTAQKLYLIFNPPTFASKDHSSNFMKFTGTYKNGSNTESISGFVGLVAVAEENSSSMFPQPIVVFWLFQINNEGEIESILTTIWAKNGWDIFGTTVEKANTFHVNFWTL